MAATSRAAAASSPAGARQAEALRIICNHWRAFGQAPTRAELGRAMGISKVSAHMLVGKLVRDKLLVREPGTWRNVRPASIGARR